MKLVSFQSAKNSSFGLALSQADAGETLIVDAGRRLGGRFLSLRELLAADALSELVALNRPENADYRLRDVSLLPVIPDPTKILCVGINYLSHVKETGRDVPQHPMIFTRFADSQAGHDRPLIKPARSDRFDFEGELAVIVGGGGRYIAKDDALQHVAGYACYNDGSVRDWQRHPSQFIPGKNFPATGAFGPWLVTKDGLHDPSALELQTRLNGDLMQKARCDDLIFSVGDLIAYCSSFTPLEPGDAIVTGTPGGVGDFRKPPRYMRPGDIVEVEITGIGRLRNSIQAE